jgi:uncharacterized protein
MKASIYNLLFENKKYHNWLIYNSLRNSLLAIDENVKKYLETAGKLPDVQDISCHGLTIEDRDVLIEFGFIVDENFDELKAAIVADDSAHSYVQFGKYLRLTICPTYDCNLQCSYCYEVYNRDLMNYGVMNEEIQNDIIQLYHQHCLKNSGDEGENSNIDSIIWSGGEPLLNPNIINYVQGEINLLAKKHNRTVKRSIVTNGILLNAENQQMLKTNGIQHIQITIDGPDNIHNSRRYFPESPDKAFEIIMNNIRNMDNYFNISLRVNVDNENARHLEQLLEALITWKVWPLKKIGINIANIQCDWSSDSKLSISTNDFEKLKRDFRFNQLLRFNELIPGKKAKFKLEYPSNNKLNQICGSVNHKNSFVIGPQGELYTCWKSVGNKKFQIGSLNDILLNNKLNNDEKQRFHSRFRKEINCYSCKILPVCSVQCPSSFLQAGKIEHELLCSKWKFALKDTLLFNYDCQTKFPDIVTEIDCQTSERH